MKKLTVCLLIPALLMTAGCRKKKKQVAQKAPEKPVPVQVATIRNRAFWLTISSIGTAKPDQIVYLKSKIPGKIIRVTVNEGDRIHRGERLLELDPTDYRLAVANAREALKAARLAHEEAVVSLKNIMKDWTRYHRLYEKRVISKQKWDHMDAAKRKAQIFQEITRARVSRAKVALEIAQTNLRHTRIVAPFDGVVTRRLVDPGDRVYTMPPTVLMVVMDISRIKVVSDLPEKEMPLIHPGTPVFISFDALPGKVFEGRITRIYPRVDPVTRNFSIEMDLKNPDRAMKAGMFAHVRVRVKKVQGLVIPRSALLKIPGTGTYYAFKVTGDTVKKVNLKTGIVQDTFVQVLGGLREGDRVVTVGNAALRTGRKIRIVRQGNPS